MVNNNNNKSGIEQLNRGSLKGAGSIILIMKGAEEMGKKMGYLKGCGQ